MGEWILPLLETTSLLLAIWCLADALRRGPRYVAELLAGAIFGLAIEQIAIHLGGAAGRPDAYTYGAFRWMITRDVPLVIATGWGSILYAAMKYTDSLGIPLWMRPAADGLYALALDLTMDVVASRLGIWHWSASPGSQWFGVPFSNFGGWLVLAVLFSALVRLARLIAARWGGPTLEAALLAVICGMGPFMTIRVLGVLFTGTEQDAWPVGLLALMAAGILAAGLLWRRRASPEEMRAALADGEPPDLRPGLRLDGTVLAWLDPALGVPLFWHVSYLGVAVLSGVFAESLALLFLTGAMAAGGLLLVVGLMPVEK